MLSDEAELYLLSIDA